MRRCGFPAARVLGMVSALASASGARAQERFQPEAAFPPDAVVYARVASVERLTAGFAGTLFGRIVKHPRFQAALGKLPQLIQETLRAQGEGPLDPGGVLQNLELVRGEVAFAATLPGPGGPAGLVAAVELGPSREAILKRLGEIDAVLKEALGGGEDLPSKDIGGLPVVVWPFPGGHEIGRVVVGTHLVAAMPPELLEKVIQAHRVPPPRPLRDAAFMASLRPRLALPSGEAFLAFNVAACLAMVPRQPGAAFTPGLQILDATGLSGVSAAGLALGFRDGELEAKLHLATPGGARGILGVVAGSLAVPQGIERALARVPAAASIIGVARLHTGKLVGGALRELREKAPDAMAAVEMAVNWIESALEVSVEDLEPLPPISYVSFAVSPPAGGLIDDSIAFIRTEEFGPFQALLTKAAGEGGLQVLEEDGRTIRRSPLGAFAALEDGWTAYSSTLVSLRRYLSYVAGGPKLGDDPARLAAARRRLEGAPVAVLLRGARMNLVAYNTVVSLLNLFAPSFEAYLTPYGVDPGLLPPGEEFLAGLDDGFLRVETGPEGLTFHGHRMVSGSGSLTVIAVGSVFAGFLIPTIVQARGRADIVRCQSNLRQIHRLGTLYADTSGSRAYPYSPQGSVAALQVLINFHDGLRPELFICHASGLDAPPKDAQGRVKLDAEHCGYETVPWKLETSSPPNAIFAFDRTPCHQGRRNVVYIDGSVALIDEGDFEEQLKRDRGRFSGAEKPVKKASPKAVRPKGAAPKGAPPAKGAPSRKSAPKAPPEGGKREAEEDGGR